MSRRSVAFLLVVLGLALSAKVAFAQDTPPTSPTPQQPVSKQQAEEKRKLESKAVALLEQVVSEAQALKLNENRVRVQIAAGDTLWSRNPGRARGLFSDAATTIAQMISRPGGGDRDESNTTALRRELVLIAARHDVELAFQLLSATQSHAQADNLMNDSGVDSETNLIQTLLSISAASDPKLAYQKVVESLDKGEYPASAGSVLRQLYSKDKEAFTKLSKKLLSKLTIDNLIASEAAGSLALDLLRSGPLSEDPPSGSPVENKSGGNQTLEASAYHDLLEAAIRAALTPAPPVIRPTTPDAITFMGLDAPPPTRDATMIFSSDGRRGFSFNQTSTQPGDDQTRRNNIETLLTGLQRLLPQIDQHFPDRAQLVRHKLTELGIGSNQVISLDRGTIESLVKAAKLAPSEIQSQIYQRAAQKAIDEGNLDQALQIAHDHLEGAEREAIGLAVELKSAAADTSPKLAKIREKLAALPSDSARLRALISLAMVTEKENPKLALTFLESAREIVSRRATNYQDFQNQLNVADAFAALDVKRGFEVLEWGMSQLNEILAASAVVNGFEAEVFRDGELPFQGGSELGNMVARYGWELGSLARIDFDHATTTADKFQLPEARLLTKLLIAQVVLGSKTPTTFAPQLLR